MNFFNRMKESLTATGTVVGQKVSLTADTLKLNNQIHSNEAEIEKLIHHVGVQCVQNHLEDGDSEYEELFAQIRRLQASNAALQQEIQQLSDQCDEKSRQVQEDLQKKQAQWDQERQEKEARKQEKQRADAASAAQPLDSNQKTCPHCKKMNDLDAQFCIHCGKAFEEET